VNTAAIDGLDEFVDLGRGMLWAFNLGAVVHELQRPQSTDQLAVELLSVDRSGRDGSVVEDRSK
jgi:hypothetical protein